VERLVIGPLSVKWFGATGGNAAANGVRGSSDDTAAIAAAFSAATSGGLGGHVYLPSGTYRTSSTLSVVSGTILSGDGATSIIDFQPSASAPCVSVSGPANHVVLRNLSIQSTSAFASVAVTLSNTTDALLDALYVSSANGQGFTLAGFQLVGSNGYNCFSVTIAHCDIFQCNGDGINISGYTPGGIYICNNDIHANGHFSGGVALGWGINSTNDGTTGEPVTEVHIIDNTLEGNIAGQVTGSYGPGSIVGNHLEDTPGVGFTVPGTAPLVSIAYFRALIVERNNFVAGSTRSGLQNAPPYLLAITGNPPPVSGGLSIRGNKFSGATEACICLASGSDIEVQGNWNPNPVPYINLPQRGLVGSIRSQQAGDTTCAPIHYTSSSVTSLDIFSEVVFLSENVSVPIPDAAAFRGGKSYTFKNVGTGMATVSTGVFGGVQQFVDGYTTATLPANAWIKVTSYINLDTSTYTWAVTGGTGYELS
jgi:hypothetical protein